MDNDGEDEMPVTRAGSSAGENDEKPLTEDEKKLFLTNLTTKLTALSQRNDPITDRDKRTIAVGILAYPEILNIKDANDNNIMHNMARNTCSNLFNYFQDLVNPASIPTLSITKLRDTEKKILQEAGFLNASTDTNQNLMDVSNVQDKFKIPIGKFIHSLNNQNLTPATIANSMLDGVWSRKVTALSAQLSEDPIVLSDLRAKETIDNAKTQKEYAIRQARSSSFDDPHGVGDASYTPPQKNSISRTSSSTDMGGPS
jgi:hypothetical protein